MSAIDPKDLPEIIDLATRLESADDDAMTLAEVQRIAAELDLSPEAVREAIDTLGARRRADAAAALAQRQMLRRALIGTAVVLAMVLGLGLMGRSALVAAQSQVDRATAQLQNVTERQAATEARYAGVADSPDRRAELDGAANRVHIERRRRDEAVAAYGHAAQGVRGALARALFGWPATPREGGAP